MMDVRHRINEMVEKEIISLADLKRALGYGKSTISQVLSGKYGASADKIIDGLGLFLQEWDYRQGLCQTKGFVSIQEVLALTSKYKEMAVIVGTSGAGKTEAVKYYCMLHENAVYIVMNKVITAKELLEQILSALNVSSPGGSLNNRLITIQKSLKRRFRMLVIDESDLLQVRHLETLRAIYDYGYCAMVLIGLPRLSMLLTRGQSQKDNLAQLYSRVGFKRDILPPKKEDVEMIAQKCGYTLPRQSIDDVLTWIHNAGELRTLDKLIKRAELFKDIGDDQEEHIRAAYSLLEQ